MPSPRHEQKCCHWSLLDWLKEYCSAGGAALRHDRSWPITGFWEVSFSAIEFVAFPLEADITKLNPSRDAICRFLQDGCIFHEQYS
jgi:hypothetical protein